MLVFDLRIKITKAVEDEVDLADMKRKKHGSQEADENSSLSKRKNLKRSKHSEKVTEPVQEIEEGEEGEGGEGDLSANKKILMVHTENLQHSSFEKTRELKVWYDVDSGLLHFCCCRVFMEIFRPFLLR